MKSRPPEHPTLRLALLALCGIAAGLPCGLEAAWAKRKAAAPSPASEARERAQALPAEPYWPYRLAELQLAADSIAAAEASLTAALARDARYAPALSLLSSLHYRKGRHEEAIRLLESARGAAGGDGLPPALLAGLALHYEAAGKPAEARATLGSIAKPERDARTAAVFLTLRGAAPDSADAGAAAAWREHPKSAASQNNYGITRLRSGDVEAAQRAFNAAIELDPGLPGPYYNLAILEKFYLQDHAAATRWFQLYRQRSQDDPDGLSQVLTQGPKEKLAEQKGGD